MNNEKMPRSLELLARYLQAEKIAWKDTQPGTDVVVEARDVTTDDSAFFGFKIVDAERTKDGSTSVVLELDENDFTFVRGDSREVVHLPKGTLMREGISCQHFPKTNGFMSYIGGIGVNRDYNFSEVMTPDGEIIDTVLVPGVKNLFSFLPDGGYEEPDSVDSYRKKIDIYNQKEGQEFDDAAAELDAVITERLEALFHDESIRTEVADTINTFHPSGRYKLLCLLEFAGEDGVIDKYPMALSSALSEEFSYAPPVVARGIDFLPASSRGYDMMIRELGIILPRPAKS